MSALRYWDGKRIDLDGAVVMPDHVHMIFRVTDDSRLGKVLQSIRGFSSREIGRVIGLRGSIWQAESFDRVVRDEKEWVDKLAYMFLNPVKNGLVTNARGYRWIYVKDPAWIEDAG